MLAELAIAFLLAATDPPPGHCGTPPPVSPPTRPAQGVFDLELAAFGRQLQPEDGENCSGLQGITLVTLAAQYTLFGENEDAARMEAVLVRFFESQVAANPSSRQIQMNLEQTRLNLAAAKGRLGDMDAFSDAATLFLAKYGDTETAGQYRGHINSIAAAAMDIGAYSVAKDLAHRSLDLTKSALASRPYFSSDTSAQTKEAVECDHFVDALTKDLDAAVTSHDQAKFSALTKHARRCSKLDTETLQRQSDRDVHRDALTILAQSDLALGLDTEADSALHQLLGAPADYSVDAGIALIAAEELKRGGNPKWHDIALDARREAKRDLGLHDEFATFTGQHLAIEFAMPDRNRSELSVISLARAGETELILGRPAEALTFLEAAEPSIGAALGKSGLVEPRIRYLTGLAYLDLHSPATALPYLASASQAYDAFAPTSRDARKLTQSRFEGAIDIHLAYLEAAIAAGDMAARDEALLRAGRSQISRSLAPTSADAEPEFRRARDAARDATERDREVARAIATGRHSDEIQELVNAAQRARAAASQAQFAALAARPGIALFGLGPLVPLSDLRARLPPRAAILILALGRDRGYVALISRDATTVRPIVESRARIVAAVQRLRRSVEFLRTSQGYSLEPFDLVDSEWLDDSLLGPVRCELAAIDRLYISRSFPLDALPFAALRDNQSNSWLGLAKTLSIVLDPSGLAARPAVATQHALGALAMGDPEINLGTLLRDLTIDGAHSMIADPGNSPSASLPGATDELNAVVKAIGAVNSHIWIGQAATEKRFTSEATRDYRVLAIASHAGTESKTYRVPTPVIVFTPVEGAGPDNDGLLHPTEIERLHIRADLVILSACETAAGDGQPGAEGLSGLAQSFLYAGAKSLLATQWRVNSSSAAQMMSSMARKLKSGSDAAAALRYAMADLEREKDSRHPAYWAPFVVVDSSIH